MCVSLTRPPPGIVFVKTGAVLSGLRTDDDDDAVCNVTSHMVHSGLFRDMEPNGQKRYLGTLRTICVCLFFPVLLWLLTYLLTFLFIQSKYMGP